MESDALKLAGAIAPIGLPAGALPAGLWDAPFKANHPPAAPWALKGNVIIEVAALIGATYMSAARR